MIAVLTVFAPESVTEAVIVWVPSLKITLIVSPVPSAPSRLDVHDIEVDIFPSLGSVANPINETNVPENIEDWFSGFVILIAGAPSVIVTVIESDAKFPPLSVTAAVMV